MTFSAPKSVSVLWALSEGHEREAIEHAHRSAVLAATSHLEATAGWARRGRGGATRERTAGLLMAQFDHHTSRESDPQLHTHAFIFNLGPRRDGSWGAIISRELYRAQKQVGATYRRALASELERQGIRLERQTNTFRVAAIPRDVERAFSKRRQAIEEAARIHGYSTPKGMELATLRTLRPKRDARLGDLIKHWQAEAKALGFELGQSRQHVQTMVASSGRPGPTRSAGRQNAPSPPTVGVRTINGRAGNHKHRATPRGPTRVPARPGHSCTGSTCGHVRRQDQAALPRARAGMTDSQQGFRFLEHRQRSGRSTSSA
jgi:conjugative relaxase-like TrwC/TraI family protein